MKRGRALKTIHREVVGTSAGHLALSNRLTLCRAGLKNEAVIAWIEGFANIGRSALAEAFFPHVAKRLAGEDVR